MTRYKHEANLGFECVELKVNEKQKKLISDTIISFSHTLNRIIQDLNSGRLDFDNIRTTEVVSNLPKPLLLGAIYGAKRAANRYFKNKKSKVSKVPPVARWEFFVSSEYFKIDGTEIEFPVMDSMGCLEYIRVETNMNATQWGKFLCSKSLSNRIMTIKIFINDDGDVIADIPYQLPY